MELNNRELASVILVMLLIVATVILARDRAGLLSIYRDIVRLFFAWKIQLVVLVYLAYTAAAVAVASYLDQWTIDLFKETLLIAVFVGFPLVMNAGKLQSGKALIGSVLRETLGVSALLAFYIGLATFALWGELLLQFGVLVLVVTWYTARRKPEARMRAFISQGMLAAIGIGLIVFTTYTLVTTWDEVDVQKEWRSLALSIWLPLVLIPLVYVLALLFRSEVVLRILPRHNNNTQPPLRVRLAFLIGIHLSAFYAANFSGQWLGRLAKESTFRGARRVMKDYRERVRANVRAERDRVHRLRAMAGVEGEDDKGLRRDRREFAGTKKVLNHLFYMQMGWYRNLGRFRPDILDILGDVTREGLPQEHGIEVRVGNDGQGWYAWRRTVGGWYFGIGGGSDLTTEWQFDGPEPPEGFPADGSAWTDATRNPARTEWAANDNPIRVA